jgi:hypothetical protein
MLEDTLQQIAGHADVKCVTPAGHDIGKIIALFHGEYLAQFVDDGKQFTVDF